MPSKNAMVTHLKTKDDIVIKEINQDGAAKMWGVENYINE